ncbi:MAG: dihydrolipoamide acetyltransferase family protein [Bacteroidota bacterium]|nr:dihydrolipoamide acetyltransferase family protein [Bacteroidota bacterium]
MATIEVVLPLMGESIYEAVILKWLKKEGDKISEDESIVEIATDKVDSEIPSPSNGVLSKLLFNEGSIVKIGSTIALIETGIKESEIKAPRFEIVNKEAEAEVKTTDFNKPEVENTPAEKLTDSENRFYSPLVRKIAKEENITLDELRTIKGTGEAGKLTKTDITDYLNKREEISNIAQKGSVTQTPGEEKQTYTTKLSQGDEIIEMDRVRKLIAEHMVFSKHTSAHVTSFAEADITNLVHWRERIKEKFEILHNVKLTYTSIFIEAVAKAIEEFPLINSSLENDKIIIKKKINIGIATALPNDNLIVPVIKNVNEINLAGIAKRVSEITLKARDNKLLPGDITEGTFTITNFGTYGGISGTPIIYQPQVAILGIGAIKKRPYVVETPMGDAISIRNIVILSLSHDHRIIDGSFAGKFINKLISLLENFDIKRTD